jgi:ABC-type ATPase with predicted acetyltransferase domain
MRVNIARAILQKQKLIVFDEFTSVVDREVAKVSSLAMQKAIRRTNRQFIAVTCHYDIVPWLEPSWILCTDDMSFTKKKLPDQPLLFKSSNAAEVYGASLGSITI